ncbi:MAG: HEPN domain-containing protein [Bacteroides sp.]|nr:HEPN domain-containing protein [Bacteroides sp.]
MKKSLAHLPAQRREDLHMITELIRRYLSDKCEMVILYGSYATGEYVEYDERIEYGVPTCFRSDYDILVVTNSRFKKEVINHILKNKVAEQYYRYKGDPYRLSTTSIQFVQESINDLNKAIDKRRYFYCDIKKKGIMLYDSGNYKLARLRKLNYTEIKEMAEEYFEDKFQYGTGFLKNACFSYEQELYKMSAFLLHQACENFYRAILLTYTLYAGKEHSLEELSQQAKSNVLEVAQVFPRGTQEEKRLFQLLQESYIQARYNRSFVVTREDIDALLPRVQLLADLTEKHGRQRLAWYDSKVRRGRKKEA